MQSRGRINLSLIAAAPVLLPTLKTLVEALLHSEFDGEIDIQMYHEGKHVIDSATPGDRR